MCQLPCFGDTKRLDEFKKKLKVFRKIGKKYNKKIYINLILKKALLNDIKCIADSLHIDSNQKREILIKKINENMNNV